MRCVASAFGRASAMTVESCTPSHSTSIFDQVVTQWKSLVSFTCGSARKSFQERRAGSSTAPSTISSHFDSGTFGCRPRSRTGHPCVRSEEHTSELQSRFDLVCRLLLEKKKKKSSDVVPHKPGHRLGHRVFLDSDTPAT